MLIRGQAQEVSHETLDTFSNSLGNLRILDDEGSEIDADTTPPDIEWTRNNIIGWLKSNDIRTRAGLTKAQLLNRVDEYLNPIVEETVEEEEESTEENNSGDDLGEDTQE
jgi:hypothetical protein